MGHHLLESGAQLCRLSPELMCEFAHETSFVDDHARVGVSAWHDAAAL